MNRKLKFLLNLVTWLPWTIYFNFHYLPIKQAIKLPIVLYKPKLRHCKGKVRIIGKVRSLMIKLGFDDVPIYPNEGIMWDCKGTVIFKGNTTIGNSSRLSIGKLGFIEFGSGFIATCGFKLVCYNKVTFQKDVLIGWDCTVTDTDFHVVFQNCKKTRGYGKIIIGDNTWIAMQTLILKDTALPSHSVIGARSILNKDYTKYGSNILLAGAPATIKAHDIYYDRYNDIIEYI